MHLRKYAAGFCISKDAFQAQAGQLFFFFPFDADRLVSAFSAKIRNVVHVDMYCSFFSVQVEKLFQILSRHQTMQVVLLFEAQPSKDTFVAPTAVAGLAGPYHIIRRILTASASGN